jgi:hypothetical protein
MLAKRVAMLLVLLCAVPVTAPFSVPLHPFSNGHAMGVALSHDLLSPAVADHNSDDAVALERWSFRNERRGGACAAVPHAITTVWTASTEALTAAPPRFDPPARAVVLRV